MTFGAPLSGLSTACQADLMGMVLKTNNNLLALQALFLLPPRSKFRQLQNIPELQNGVNLLPLKYVIREYIDILLFHLKYVISIIIKIRYIMSNSYNFIINTFICNGNNCRKRLLVWFLMSQYQFEIFTRNYNSNLKKEQALFCFLLYQIYYNQQLIASKQSNQHAENFMGKSSTIILLILLIVI